jgi:excisionase family DNA binding protein
MAKFGTRSDELIVSASETHSVPEAGRRVGLGKNASYDAARRGELPVLRFGRALRVPRAALDRMLAEGRLSGFVDQK